MNAITENFLLNDVEELIKIINSNSDLSTAKLNGTFETLGDFALYWERHLPSLRGAKNNIDIGGTNSPLLTDNKALINQHGQRTKSLHTTNQGRERAERPRREPRPTNR